MDHQKTENEPVGHSNTRYYVIDSAHTYRGDFESEVVEEVKDVVFVCTAISVVYELNWVRSILSYKCGDCLMFFSRPAQVKLEIKVSPGECYFLAFKKLY